MHTKNISINQFLYGSNPQEVAKNSLRYKILKLYEANVSAGGGCENDRGIYSNVVFDAKMLDKLQLEDCELACVRGDSMEHAMSDKSLYFINKKERRIKDSKILLSIHLKAYILSNATSKVRI